MYHLILYIYNLCYFSFYYKIFANKLQKTASKDFPLFSSSNERENGVSTISWNIAPVICSNTYPFTYFGRGSTTSMACWSQVGQILDSTKHITGVIILDIGTYTE